MSEQLTDTSTSTGSEPSTSYVQSLIGPAGEQSLDTASDLTPTTQQTAANTGTTPKDAAAPATEIPTTKPATTDTAAVAQPTVEDLIQQFAKETGLDPSDPNQKKTLKRLADKELHILKLQADNESLKGTTAATAATSEFLTDFEKELLVEAAAPDKQPIPIDGKPAATEKPVQDVAAPVKYNDIGDGWKTPADSLTDLNEAWAANDLPKVHEIEVARMTRNFDTVIAPAFLDHISRMLDAKLKGFVEKDLGDVIPEVRRTVADRHVAQDRDFAIDQLRKAGAADIDGLFTAEDGPPIKFDGEEFPNTPLNRILAKFPQILQIQVKHADPAKAARQTFIARYKMAYQIHKQGSASVPAETAKQLVEAGRQSKERESNDRARQSLNAGSGKSGVGTDKQPPRSYIGELNALPGEVSLNSLLS